MTRPVGRTPGDARKLTEDYRDRQNIIEQPYIQPDLPTYLRETDIGVTQGAAPADSVNNSVNSSYRSDPNSTSGQFEYTGVHNPWNVEIADMTTVSLVRIMTGEWVILTANCPVA